MSSLGERREIRSQAPVDLPRDVTHLKDEDGQGIATGLTFEELHQLMPWVADLQVELLRAEPDEVVGRIQWQERLCTAAGVLHGGVLLGTADAIGAVCAFLKPAPGFHDNHYRVEVQLLPRRSRWIRRRCCNTPASGKDDGRYTNELAGCSRTPSRPSH